MGKLFFRALLISCCAAPAAAQSDDDAPRAEFFAGYSVMRINYEAERRDPPSLTVVGFDGKQTMHGFNVSAAGYLAGDFALAGDFSAHFKTNRLPDPLGGDIRTRVRVFNVLGGPQYKFRNGGRARPFVRALAGVAHTRSTISVASLNAASTVSSTDFALALGGGLDVRAGDRFDLRVVQADYNPVFLRRGNELGFGRSRADNVRFSFGVVFK